jgi:hypothetical protein
MQDLMAAWQADVAKQPQWVQYWMDIMVVVLGVFAVPFSFVRVEARWILAGFLAGAGTLMALYSQIGYSRLLGPCPCDLLDAGAGLSGPSACTMAREPDPVRKMDRSFRHGTDGFTGFRLYRRDPLDSRRALIQ